MSCTEARMVVVRSSATFRSMEAGIEDLSWGNRARTLRLDGQLNIGRADACQVQLGDTYVSQFHARLFPREGGWFVEDLGSTNGTYLNQRRLTSQAAVQAGDRIRVGKTTLELRR